jgi:hypothetical protein
LTKDGLVAEQSFVAAVMDSGAHGLMRSVCACLLHNVVGFLSQLAALNKLRAPCPLQRTLPMDEIDIALKHTLGL